MEKYKLSKSKIYDTLLNLGVNLKVQEMSKIFYF